MTHTCTRHNRQAAALGEAEEREKNRNKTVGRVIRVVDNRREKRRRE